MRYSGGYGAPVAGRLSAAGLAPPAGICEQAVALRLYGFSAGAAGGSGFSQVKRRAGIKDYSRLLPGHGGLLDRFDSALFVLPYTVVFLWYLPLL